MIVIYDIYRHSNERKNSETQTDNYLDDLVTHYVSKREYGWFQYLFKEIELKNMREELKLAKKSLPEPREFSLTGNNTVDIQSCTN